MGIEITNCDTLALTREIEIISPTSGQGTGAFVTIAGPEHPAIKQRELQRQRERRASIEAGSLPDDAPETEQQRRIDDAVSATIEWRGFTREGKPIPCTPDEVRSLYSTQGLIWIPGQVISATNKLRDFFIPPAQPVPEEQATK